MKIVCLNMGKITLSILSGRLVAATNVTLPRVVTPSSSVNNCANTRSCTLLPLPLEEEPLSPPNASISSINMMDGATCLAFRNTSLTAFSDSPTHFENNSGPCK